MSGSQDKFPPEPIMTVQYSEPLPPALTASGRPQRNYQRPAKYCDLYPEGMPPAVLLPSAVLLLTPASLIQHIVLIVQNPLSMASNVFGMWKKYLY